MSVEKVMRAGGEVVWRVRWRQHGRTAHERFSTRRDARDFDAEVRRQRRAGSLAALDAGAATFGEYVTGAWAASHAATLAAKTRLHYASLYDHHLRPYLDSIALREMTPEVIGRWQADRLASGAGPIAIRHAMDLLGSILEHAFVGGHLSANPARRVKKARAPRREEVRPLSPSTIEAMRMALAARDATLISVLAYAGLRPGEALVLRWGDVRDQTLLIQRAISLGEESDTQDTSAPHGPPASAACRGHAVLADGCRLARGL
jgi:integrase